ncbi:hypothetical protein F4808DRAFT_449683 [Astrocystis sublimbata]|nr:hypothetical protein F4808DRAFT_449683 [Astrocystis sublimbata]
MATVSPYKPDSLPFIHRAWKTAVDHLPYSMGIKLSTANGETPTNGDPPSRPLKRRRVVEPEASPTAARAMPSRLLPEVPDDIEKALRIEVLSITRVDSSNPRPLHYGNGSPEKKDIPVIKARCRVLICEWGLDICRVLHVDSQICNFKVFRDPDDVCRTARIYLPTPFLIPSEKLLIERQDGRGFTFGDQYLVRVEIESSGDPKWPPMDLLPQNQANEPPDLAPNRWVVSSQIIYEFAKGRSSGKVVINKKKQEIPLDMVMDMDLRWSTSHAAATSVRLGKSVPPPENKTVCVNGPLEPVTNGRVDEKVDPPPEDEPMAGTETNGVAHEDEEDREEATTPSRHLRTRGKQQNYNLKLLSDKARGKEKKEKKQRKLATLNRKSGSVTWAVPLLGEFTLESFHCIRCFATHASIQLLKQHLEVHEDITYSVDTEHAYIRIFAPDEDALRSANPTFHSFSSFDDHDSDAEGESPRKQQKRSSRQRSRPPLFHPFKPKDSRLLIPKIKEPLYDRLSKARLDPGSLVDPPPVNDTWLVQKHRDIIRDYSDVLPDEKEYILEWDAFVNKRCVTSTPHLQDVYINFIEEKAPWLAASQNRMAEWAKHLSYLKFRSALTEETIIKALTIMRRSRSEKQPELPETPKTSSPKAAYRKSVAGCPVCGQPVRATASLICSNMNCSNGMYHRECMRSNALQPVGSRNWRCNKCHDVQMTGT